jgi:hypothetical protein
VEAQPERTVTSTTTIFDLEMMPDEMRDALASATSR